MKKKFSAGTCGLAGLLGASLILSGLSLPVRVQAEEEAEEGGIVITVPDGTEPYEEPDCIILSDPAEEETLTVNGTTDSSKAVGALSILATFTEGQPFYEGHSYLLFTSYKDDLTLSFSNLYGYYTFTGDFKELTEADINELSWQSRNTHLTELCEAAGVDPEIYKALSDDEKAAQYPDIVEAMKQYDVDNCFDTTLGEDQEDSRYKKTTYECTLNTGDYITIGNYTMSGDMETVADAILNSTKSATFIQTLKNNILDDLTDDRILEALAQYFQDYLDDKISGEELKSDIEGYLLQHVAKAAVDTLMELLFGNASMLDGDSSGGLFVNRELYRQKDWQDLYPNAIYTMEIDETELNDLMAFLNSDQNHYSAIYHNCSYVSSNGWNAAFGYVRDENGQNTEEKTSLYIDAKDTIFGLFDGMADTPRKIYSVITSWGDDTPGTRTFMNIIHGTEVPTTPTPTEEPTEEPTPEPTEEPTAEPTEEPTIVPTEEPVPIEPTLVPTATPTEVPTSPETGEPANMGLILGLLIAVSAAGSLILYKRTRKEER